MSEVNEAVFASFQKNLVSWYETNKRELPWRESQEPYRVWVSEIMLQQTRVDTVIPYYERFMRMFPEMEDLAYANEEDLLKVWEGLGYYSRVRNLQTAVREVVEDYDGVVPNNRKDIEGLKGVGPYTAGAILSIAYDQAEPAVDGNVMRVLSRVFCIEDDIAKPQTRKKHEAILYDLIDKQNPSSFNQGLMELGALVCTPTSPGCLLCPVREQCMAYDQGKQHELPVKSKKKKARSVKIDAFLLTDNKDRVLIEKRPEKGLLAGLWQLPMLEKASNSFGMQDEWFKTHLEDIKPIKTTFQVRHVFSHLIWEIDLYIGQIVLDEVPTTCKFVTKKELEEYAFPVSQQKLLTYSLEEDLL